jgi:hypothetical protein
VISADFNGRQSNTEVNGSSFPTGYTDLHKVELYIRIIQIILQGTCVYPVPMPLVL